MCESFVYSHFHGFRCQADGLYGPVVLNIFTCCEFLCIKTAKLLVKFSQDIYLFVYLYWSTEELGANIVKLEGGEFVFFSTLHLLDKDVFSHLAVT